MEMTTIRKKASFLLVLCVISALAVSVCAMEHPSGEDDAPDYSKSASVEAAPSLDNAETETKKTVERTSNVESAAGKEWLPALGYIAGQLLLILAAFWCAAKNRKRRRYCT